MYDDEDYHQRSIEEAPPLVFKYCNEERAQRGLTHVNHTELPNSAERTALEVEGV